MVSEHENTAVIEFAVLLRLGRAALWSYLAAQLLRLEWSEGLVFGRSAVSPFRGHTMIYRADQAWTKAGLGRLTPQ